MFNKKLLALACAGLFAAGTAHAAATFSQAIVPGVNNLSDDDAELVLKYVPGTAGAAGTYRAFIPGQDTVQVNDILIGLVGITSFPDGALGTSAALYNQVTAIYALQALTASPYASSGPCGGIASISTCTDYTFGVATLASATDPLNAAIALMNSIYGTTVAAFGNTTAKSFASVQEDTTAASAFTRTAATLDAAFDSGADGIQRFVFDLVGGNSDYFQTNAPADVTELNEGPSGANKGSFGGQGTISYQNVPGWAFDPAVTITGNLTNASAGPFGIWSDSTYRINATPVPEPTTLALLGLGLAALGAGRIRRGKLAK